MRDPIDAPSIGRLKRRADFVRAGQGKRWHGKAMTLQAGPPRRPTEDGATEGAAAFPRVGFTLTKKVGCAVIRNRARRRLKEALRLSKDLPVKPGHDYVIVGRIDAIRLPFDAIKTELTRALTSVHDEARAGSRRPEGRHKRIRPKP